MNIPILIAIISAVFGAGGIAVAIFQAIVGRGAQRADIADKVSAAWDPVFDRMDKDIARLEKKSDKCEVRLAVTERQLTEATEQIHKFKTTARIVVKAYRANDPAAMEMAIVATEELIS